YICPVKSLPCVKKHKEASGCSGVRNKTAFVTLSQFDEMTLLSDYRFLEDTGRFANGATRDNLVQAPRVTVKVSPAFIDLVFGTIIDPLFSLAFASLLTMAFFCCRVSDKQTLKQILTAYIHPTESEPVTRQKLKMYVQARFDHVKVFMKVEGRKANAVRYHELDIEKSLRDNLSYKTLIEYPVLHVTRKQEMSPCFFSPLCHFPLLRGFQCRERSVASKQDSEKHARHFGSCEMCTVRSSCGYRSTFGMNTKDHTNTVSQLLSEPDWPNGE
uniref:BCD1 alpha/beta domain-containing protein n=1 Tax=Oreochromis aureus TaxID=47969 RepID=A0A668VCP4_OREAU